MATPCFSRISLLVTTSPIWLLYNLPSRRLGHRKGRRQGAKLQLRHAKMLDQGWSHPQKSPLLWTTLREIVREWGHGGEWTTNGFPYTIQILHDSDHVHSYYPMTDPCMPIYGITWIPSIYPSHVSIYIYIYQHHGSVMGIVVVFYIF